MQSMFRRARTATDETEAPKKWVAIKKSKLASSKGDTPMLKN